MCWISASEAHFPGHFGPPNRTWFRSLVIFSNIFHWFHIILVLHACWGVYLGVFQCVFPVAAELVRPSGHLLTERMWKVSFPAHLVRGVLLSSLVFYFRFTEEGSLCVHYHEDFIFAKIHRKISMQELLIFVYEFTSLINLFCPIFTSLSKFAFQDTVCSLKIAILLTVLVSHRVDCNSIFIGMLVPEGMYRSVL